MRIFILLMILLAIGCQQEETMEEVTGNHVIELEETACDAADGAGTCDTKLARLGFITKEDCCSRYQKCC